MSPTPVWLRNFRQQRRTKLPEQPFARHPYTSDEAPRHRKDPTWVEALWWVVTLVTLVTALWACGLLTEARLAGAFPW